MNLREEVERLIVQGYNEAGAEARVAQDIILKCIQISKLNDNITIKGGVVMRNISNNIRRATQDLDFDVICYPISNEGIERLIDNLNVMDGINLMINGEIIELKHHDYHGRRVSIVIEDCFNNQIGLKLDIGVQADLSIEQGECCFDLCFQEEGIVLLINSGEQMIVEKNTITIYVKLNTIQRYI